MLSELFLNTISGVITGFSTNKVAINMLFQKYFGIFGGVIEDNHKEFIENISKLIEKDLINDTTLKSEINKEDFKNVLKEIIKETLLIELPKKGDKRLNQLKGFTKTKNNLIPFIKNFEQTFFNELKEYKISNFISPIQAKIISSNLNSVISNSSFNKTIFEIISEKKVEEIFLDETIQTIIENSKKFINKDFYQFDEDINQFFTNFIQNTNLIETLKQMEIHLNNLYVKDFINDKNNLSKKIISRGLEILDNKKIEEFIKQFLIILKKIDKSIFELLDDNSKEKFEQFIKTKFPVIIEKIVIFIKQNKTELENIINQEIDDVLEGSFVGILKNLFFKNLANEKGFISQIINFINNYEKDSAKNISEKFITYLQNYSIGEIISQLEEKKLINIKKITYLIQKNLKELENKNFDFIENLLNKQIKDIKYIKIDIEFLYKIFEKIKTNYIYTENFKNHLKQEIENSLQNLKNKPIKKFINKIDFEPNIELPLNIKISEFNKQIELTEKLDFVFNLKLNSIYQKFQNENSYSKIQKISISLLNQKLENLLSGNVSIAVSKELEKFQPSQIKDIVENFMGKELKPINTLGAILGGVAGAGYYGTTLMLNNPYMNYFTPFIYGITGIATNKLAIKMLFRPYEKKSYLPFFSPSVIVKNKPKFAKNISNFVKNDILTDEALIKIFETHKTNWQKFLKQTLSKNNYEIIDNLLKEKINPLSELTFHLLNLYISEHSDNLSENIVNSFKNSKPNTKNLSKQIIKKLYNYDFSKFYIFIDEKLDSELKTFIPFILTHFENNFELFINEIQKNLTTKNIKKLILNYEDEYNLFISNNNLELFINQTIKNNLQTKISNLFNENIIKIITQKIETEFNPNLKLNQLLNGGIEKILENNLNYIIQIIINSIQEYKPLLQKKALENIPFGTGWLLKDKTIQVVDNIMDKALPKFINQKNEELEIILKQLLDYKIDEIGFNINKEKTLNILEKIVLSPYFQKSLLSFNNLIIDSISSISLKEVLEILNIKNLNQLFEKFESTIEIGLKQINLTDTKQISTILLEKILKNLSENKTLKTIIPSLNNDFDNWILILKENLDKFENIIEEILEKLFNTKFYDAILLKEDLSKFIKNNIIEFKKIIIPFLKDLFNNLNKIIDNDTKDEILNDFITAIFESIEINLSELMKKLNLQEIIEKEINNMNPKEIEKMFYSFAGNYFSKLELYGAFGAIFGIPTIFI